MYFLEKYSKPLNRYVSKVMLEYNYNYNYN